MYMQYTQKIYSTVSLTLYLYCWKLSFYYIICSQKYVYKTLYSSKFFVNFFRFASYYYKVSTQWKYFDWKQFFNNLC